MSGHGRWGPDRLEGGLLKSPALACASGRESKAMDGGSITMSEHTSATIQADVARILSNFEGREYPDEIGRDTRFFADLGLASIDAVVLGETLQTYYGRSLPFGELMADLGQRTDRDLRIGELVDFLTRHLGADR